MSAQTSFTLPALGGAKPVYADIRTTPYGVCVQELKYRNHSFASFEKKVKPESNFKVT